MLSKRLLSYRQASTLFTMRRSPWTITTSPGCNCRSGFDGSGRTCFFGWSRQTITAPVDGGG
jgi:hypothetical protein